MPICPLHREAILRRLKVRRQVKDRAALSRRKHAADPGVLYAVHADVIAFPDEIPPEVPAEARAMLVDEIRRWVDRNSPGLPWRRY